MIPDSEKHKPKNTRLTWKTVFNARNRHWGVLWKAADAARAAGYKFVSFNERIYEVGSEQEPTCQETGLTDDDLAIVERPVVLDTVEFKDVEGQDVMLTGAGTRLLEPTAFLFVAEDKNDRQKPTSVAYLNIEQARVLLKGLNQFVTENDVHAG